MKEIVVLSRLVMMAVFLSYCHTAKKASAPAAVTFEKNVQPIVLASCAPCHVPSKGGNKEAYDNYANAKKDADDILHRVQLNPTDRGFMPARHPKLSDTDIATLKAWKDGGMIEK